MAKVNNAYTLFEIPGLKRCYLGIPPISCDVCQTFAQKIIDVGKDSEVVSDVVDLPYPDDNRSVFCDVVKNKDLFKNLKYREIVVHSAPNMALRRRYVFALNFRATN